MEKSTNHIELEDQSMEDKKEFGAEDSKNEVKRNGSQDNITNNDQANSSEEHSVSSGEYEEDKLKEDNIFSPKNKINFRLNDCSYLDRKPDEQCGLGVHNISFIDGKYQNWEEFVSVKQEAPRLDPCTETRGGGYGRRRRRGYRGGEKEVRPKEDLSTVSVRETPIIRDSKHKKEYLKYYNMFPEIKELDIINKAIEKVNPKSIKRKRLVDTIISNAIYREYAVSQMSKQIEGRKEYIRRQEEAAKEREEKALERRRGVKRQMRRGFRRTMKELKEDLHKEAEISISKPDFPIEPKRKKKYWIENAMNAIEVYNKESEKNREVMMGYHIASCKNIIYIFHEPRECIHYHNDEDRRRRPLYYKGEWNYYPIECKQPKDHARDEQCEYAHNCEEINYHPLVYKTMLCEGEEGECNIRFCFKAHKEEELRNLVALYCMNPHSEALQPINKEKDSFIESSLLADRWELDLNTYKTVFCEKEGCNSTSCLKYHNSLEKRRDPTQWKYSNIRCPYTYKEKYLNPTNCPKDDECDRCHTKNEFCYHPKNYKTRKCERTVCNDIYCANLHSYDISKLQSDLGKLESSIEKLKRVLKSWQCPICKKQVEEVDDAAIVLCCRYMACVTCVEQLEICMQCNKPPKNATRFNNKA